MTPVIIGDATLYNGNCEDVLPLIGKVDAVITDPPFEAEAHTDMRRTQRSIKDGDNDVLGFGAITEELRNLVCGHAGTKCSGWALFFCQVEASALYRDAMVSAGAKYRRTMVWIKPDSSPQFNGQGPAQGYECISASWCGLGKSVWNGGGKRGVFTHLVNQGRFGGHPTEKPLPLMAELMSLFSNHGQTVLDPFMGSGTTGVAAIQMGRKFIGIERDERYFEIACKRIERAVSQGQLFAPEPVKQVQGSFL